MRRFSKALSLVLTLAIILSVFGMFSAFVSAADTLPTGVTEVYNMENTASYYPRNIKDAGGSVFTYYKQLDDNGDYYFSHTTKNAATVSADGWWGITGSGLGWVVQDTTAGAAKNTSYVVLDMDLSTDSFFYDGIIFPMHMYDASGTQLYGYNSRSNVYAPKINFSGTEVSSVSNAVDANKAINRFYNDNGNNWTHVTIVYDFSSATSADWSAHAYINGYYAGCVITDLSAVANINRVCAVMTGVKVGSNASMNWTNFTIRRFDTTYDDSVMSGQLANSDVTLQEIDDLAYCMENAPAEDVKVAEILRGGETIEVTDFDELDASLQNGDKVTLFKPLHRKIVVQDGYEIEWVDYTDTSSKGATNGMTAPLLYDLASYDWIIRDAKGESVLVSGSQTYDEGGELTDDALNTALDDRTSWTEVTLLDNVVSKPGRNDGGEVKGSLVLDLNGYTLTNEKGAETKLFAVGAGESLVMKNGSYSFAASNCNYAMPTNVGGALILFENMTEITTPNDGKRNPLFDIRGGVSVVFKDCDEIALYSRALANLDSNANNPSYLVIDGCDNVSTNYTALITATNNKASSSAPYNGSFNTTLTVKGSNISVASGSLMNVAAYANQAGSVSGGVFTPTDELIGANNNRMKVKLESSAVTTSADLPLIKTQIASLTTNYDFDSDGTKDDFWSTSFTLDVDVDITDNCGIKTASIVNKVAAPSTDGAPEGYALNYDVDVYAAEGTRLSTDTIFDEDGASGTYSLGATGEGVLAFTSLYDGFTYIVREKDNCDKYSYRAGNWSARYFYWNNEEGEVVDPWIAGRGEIGEKPTDTANYKNYSWILKDEPDSADLKGSYITTFDAAFNPSLNLTLNRDISLNLLLPSTIDPAKVVVSAVNANEETVAVYAFDGVVTVDGVDYYKYQIRNVTPNKADELYTYQVTITGRYKDTITKELGVSPVKYAQDMLALDTTAEDAELVALLNALLNYFEAAYAYDGVEKNFTDVAVGEAVYGTLPENGENTVIEAYQLNLKSSFTWIITLKEGVTNASVAYTLNGTPTNAEVVDGKAYITLKACDVLNAVTVTADQGTYTLNFATYITELGEVDAKVSNLLVAMSVYADAARAYQN